MIKLNRNNKGFTLVELIIVIAIIMVLVAVLAPQYTRYVEQSRESNDLQIASSIIDATIVAVADPKNEIPGNALIRVAWITTGGNGTIAVGSAHDSNLRGLKHSNGTDLATHLTNEIKAIMGDKTILAVSEVGKSQSLIFRLDADTGAVEIAGTNSSPDDNGWNAGSGLWVTEIGLGFPLSDEFYYYY